MGERRGTKGLELWCRRMTDGYPGVKIENMTTSWRDGLAFCAIIHRFRPDLIDFSKLKKNDVYHNNELAFRIAERHLGIPALLEPEDMVAFPVPDRLSILTYLSQFYQVFAVQGSSPNRIAPKRTPTSPDHSSIVSSPSTSPPSKVTVFEVGRIHREPCAKCALPVFITERLNVGKLLYHRTCFKCARCTAQLTFDNYYETENGAYCCETCPDEEIHVMPTLKNVQSVEQTSVLLRSVSDEEKTASLRMNFDDVDEYSAVFETALELPDDKSSITSEQSKEFTMARTHFMQTQLVDNNDEYKSECELNNDENDSGFPNKLDSNVNSIQSSNSIDSVSENFDKTAENIVTKEKSVIDEGNERNESSSTEEQIVLPLNSVEIKLNDDNIPMADDDDEITSTEQMSFTNNIKVDEDNKLDKSEDSLKVEDIVVISDESVLNEEINTIENNLKDDSVIVISDNSVVSEEMDKSKEYPDELNPFDDEEENVDAQPSRNSTNPFEEENDIVENLKPTPSPRLKKKHIVPNACDRVSMPLYVQRVSMEHSDSLPMEPPTPASRKKRKVIPAPKMSLNPFGSSSDEEEEDERSEKSMDKLPIPTPRLSRTSTDSQSPSSHHMHGSNTSLSSNSTAATVTLRKKKPAPKPPGTPLRATTSPGSATITHSSVVVTPNHRKSRKAPPPPPTQSNVSTPCVDRRVTEEVSFNMSPISVELQNAAHEQQIENEKCVKDETNRNRQCEEYKNESSFDSRNHVLNKSLHGKWKRRKGQAPSRPIPQKRTIKALPMDEIRRELDVIEIQLQGLEKQGVQIEKLIREKCENDAETVDALVETSLPADVEELILQLFELVNDRNELFRKQTELMYLKRQQRLEEEHADVEYQIRCLMLKPEANKTDLDKGREETLIKRLLEIVEMRNEIIECLEMDRVRETEEDNCINNHLTMYTTKNDGTKRKQQKEKKKHRKEKLFKFKSKTTDADKDIDESEMCVKQEKKKKHLKFF